MNELYYAMCQKCQRTEDFDDESERDDWAAMHWEQTKHQPEVWEEKVMVD